MHAHGEFPDILYRAFEKFEYAQSFCSGQIRFGSVMGYRNIEDEKRKDETEGTGHFVVDGVDSEVKFISNQPYALCCHLSLESALETKHGKYIVEINKPIWLAEELTRVIRLSSAKYFGGIEGVLVSYTKGHSVEEKPGSYERSRLTYTQKPEKFKHEKEFRFVFITKEFGGSNITLQLPSNIPGSLIHEYT
jgi:hypothetical protein